MKARDFSRDQENLKEKISSFDDVTGSTIGKNRKKNNKSGNMTVIKKNLASVDDRINDIRVYDTNSRNIRNKMDLMSGLASVEKFDVIVITETWLDSAVKKFATEFKMNRYNVYHKDRIGKVGGRVVIYVKNMLTSYVSTGVKSDVNNEFIWLELINEREKLIIGNIYRPPNLSREPSMLLFQENNAAAKYKNVCIIGDFN